MTARPGAFAALALSLVLLGTACGGAGAGGEGDAEEGGTIQIGGLSANDHGEQDVSGQASVDVEMDDFYFGPTVLSGEAGQTLTVRLMNEGQAPHTFTVEAIGVDVELQPGESGEGDVTLPESGALLVICRFHAGQGMRGALSVGGVLTVQGSGQGEDDSESRGGGYGAYDPY